MALHEISQRELRNNNAEVIRQVMEGNSFVVTRNGKPVADLIPHRSAEEPPMRTLGQMQAALRALPPVDARAWQEDLRRADDVFGPDDPLDDPWDRRQREE
jgi:prevent-host-death family protein